jgi:CBS domain-containing protein
MVTVKDILDRKGYKVVTVSPGDTVLTAAKLMTAEGIGGVVVVDDDGRVAGIFTERDVLRRVVAEAKSVEDTRVGDAMSDRVACCTLSTTLEDCQMAMTDKRFRHLPVVEEGKLVGIVSIGDVVRREQEDQQTTIEYLHAYIHGRA